MKHESYDVKIENEDLFELKAWLQDMRAEKTLKLTIQKSERPKTCEYERLLDIRLAIFEKIMRQLP